MKNLNLGALLSFTLAVDVRDDVIETDESCGVCFVSLYLALAAISEALGCEVNPLEDR